MCAGGACCVADGRHLSAAEALGASAASHVRVAELLVRFAAMRGDGAATDGLVAVARVVHNYGQAMCVEDAGGNFFRSQTT
jgi:hypothetical protein